MLIIDRDCVLLGPTVGTAKGKLPLELRTPLIADDTYLIGMSERSRVDCSDLLFDLARHSLDVYESKLLDSRLEELYPVCFWSGYRSALVYHNGEFYKLKGIAFDPYDPIIRDHDDYWDVYGGQFLKSVKYEKQASDSFNRVLREEGIETVMECLGHWNYEIKVKNQTLAASVIKVKGDTRLDELVWAIEKMLFMNNADSNLAVDSKTAFELSLPKLFSEEIKNLFYSMGYAVGQLKSLMDKAGQSWGASRMVSNANVGNIVIYPDGDDLKVNLVDFDASCFGKDLTKSELSGLQKWEHQQLHNQFRAIHGLPYLSMRRLNTGQGLICNDTISYELRQGYGSGYSIPKGYKSNKRNLIRNGYATLLGLMQLTLKNKEKLIGEIINEKPNDLSTLVQEVSNI